MIQSLSFSIYFGLSSPSLSLYLYGFPYKVLLFSSEHPELKLEIDNVDRHK